jgi:hypothetical protein
MALSHVVEDCSTSGKRHQPEQIVAKLRQVEVLTAHCRRVAAAIGSVGVTVNCPGVGGDMARRGSTRGAHARLPDQAPEQPRFARAGDTGARERLV